MESTTGSVSATTAGCGCLNVISDLGGSDSGRRGSVFRVGTTREGLEDQPLGQWGGHALLPSTMLEVGWTSSTALRVRVLVVSATRWGSAHLFMAIVDVSDAASGTWRNFSNVVICNHAT